MTSIAGSPERSLVTVLAVDTVGSTAHVADCDPDDAQQFLDRIFELILHAVNDAGGHLVSYAGDGGVAVFGWPDSLEDHAEKACIAAWRIVNSSVETEPITGPDGRTARYRIGVHSGLVGLRRIDYGSGNRLDTVGGTVHLASALQKSAPHNGIVVSSHTLELCRNRPPVRRFRRIPLLARVGAEAFLLTGYPEIDSTPRADRFGAPLAGRRSELARLEKALPTPGGDFASVALVGEPGIGKSRLLAEALVIGECANINILGFNGASNKQTTPFAVMQSLLFEAMRRVGIGMDDLSARLMDESGLLREDCEALARVMGSGADTAGSNAYRPTQRQISRALIAALIFLNRDEPTLLVLEDFHLADPESRDCLAQLVHDHAPPGVSLFVSLRPEALEAAKSLAKVILQLDPLPTADMFALGRSLQGDIAAPEHALWQAVHRADGIPFVLEQIILSADAQKPDKLDTLPLTVQSMIHARLNKLSATAKSVVQTISILGEQTDRAILNELLDIGPAPLGDVLDELARLGFIHAPDHSSIRFRHAIIAESCATTVPHARRRELHRRAIQAIGAGHPDLQNRFEMLAYHAEGADDPAGALDYLWRAGLHARRTSAMGSLQLIFARALRCIERLGPAANGRYVDFVLMASVPLLQIGEFDFIKPHVKKALEFAREQQRDDKICGALCQLATIRWFEGRYSEGLRFSEDALASARRLNSMPHLFAAQLVLSILLWVTADIERAIALLRELGVMLSGDLEYARLGATAIPSAMAHSFLCWALMDVGAYGEGISHAEEAIRIAGRGDDPFAECLARSALGNALLVQGKNEEAAACLRLALDLCDRNGYETSRPTVIGNYAIALARSGGARQAAATSREWLAHESGHRTGQFEYFYALKGAAEALFRDGTVEESLAIIASAVDLAKRIESPCLQLRGIETRILILAASGKAPAQLAADRRSLGQLCEHYRLRSQIG